MGEINYDNKFFAAVQTSENAEVSAETVFHYHQNGNVVWATYKGGAIEFGTLIAKVLQDSSLEMRYSQVNRNGDLQTGQCVSMPEMLSDGRIRLHEKWQWTSGDLSKGKSIVEEVRESETEK